MITLSNFIIKYLLKYDDFDKALKTFIEGFNNIICHLFN
jgi:hypothetical protein